ncbi:AzlC family ABC transporter permease [Ectopseudomonas mendocina]|uniref:AzlC family ABC transporter permease n=1 Tax=Ectopseudomonas mendocina TaxID=300 RepID=A0ABZ2RB25_ECTME
MRGQRIRAFGSGLTDSLSVAAGYLPIAFSFGVAAIQAGLPAAIAILASVIVYAGASQFLLISLLASGAGIWTALPTVMLMNARHVLYGPALIPGLSAPPQLRSPLQAFGLTDEVFATAMSKLPSINEADREHWLLGLQIGAYASWVGGTIVGVLLVAEVGNWPVSVREGLSFVLPALFFALLLETGVRRWMLPILAAALTAAVLGLFIANYNALVVAILVGAVVQAFWGKTS